jgi:hypothetical protein
MIRGMSRGALALGPILMAVLMAAQPVAATTVTSSSGSFGLATIRDSQSGKQGANCDYKTHLSHGAYPLKDISVRGPKMWAENTGSGTQHQKVAWRFRIQRDTNFDGSFGTLFTSSLVKATATDSTPAAFARRTWTPTSTVTAGNYRVQVTLIWYKPGSSTIVRGKQVVLYDWYKVQGGGTDTVRHHTCYSSNTTIPN